ncbi:MAG: pseudouridine synthase [Planctomycetota bacterium]|nr:MAG: pseudouridine synthase [Planctomycetota bacterium]
MAQQRIQRVLAAAGYGSRRACEQLVVDGRVSVNGEVTRALPILVDPAQDRIAVDGKPVRSEAHVYYLLNKPKNVFCTNVEQGGRRRAVDLLVGVRERVYPVGRLDADSTGLLILTNDGALAQKLTHPRYGAPKTYRVEVAGMPAEAVLEKLRAGVWLSEGKTSPAQITIIHRQKTKAVLEITLREGRNREIRRMLAKTGHNVRRMTLIRIGKLSIAKVPLGGFRRLMPEEVRHLYKLSEAGPDAELSFPRRRGRSASRGARGIGESASRGRRPAPSRPGIDPRPRPEKTVAKSADGKRRRSGRRILLPK